MYSYLIKRNSVSEKDIQVPEQFWKLHKIMPAIAKLEKVWMLRRCTPHVLIILSLFFIEWTRKF